MHEKEKYARKASRKVSKPKSEGTRGTIVQVDKLSDGGAGQNSVPQQPNTFSGIENGNRIVVAPPNTNI
jgi:hypothetical protein